MNGLREAAQAVIEQWDPPNWKLVVHTGVLIDRLRAALAQPETEAEPVLWQFRYIDWEEGPGGWSATQDPNFYRRRKNYEVRPLYTHPPRDEWRLASEPPEDGRRVLIWVAKSGGETFRPAYCPAGGWTSVFDGETLVAWRDVTPPTESPIAAKCQRIEGSGEICGLTPPCPDCGSSLIDVPEGSL